MQSNAIAPKSSIAKEFRGFVIQLAKDIREVNARQITDALKKGKLYKSSKEILKRKGNKEFLAENDFVAIMQRKYIQFVEVWSEFTVEQIQNVDFLVLLKLAAPKYKKVVAKLKDVAIITQQLVDSLLKELFPRSPKTPKEVTGWKQTKNGRYYNVVLHDEETGLAVEEIAEAEKVSRQKVLATAIALLKEQRAKVNNFNPAAELERFKQQGKISDYADSDGIWLITLDDEHEVEPVTQNGLPMFLRRLALAA